MPVAFVDAHEMGSDSTYFFAPEAEPYNPFITAEQRASLIMFGKTNAKRFDHFGIDYFTREVFDAFYPGYGASWPIYHGAIAMTYEQASARGLIATRYDGSQFSYAETVRNHFVASLATIETVAGNRQKLLQQFYEYRRSAIEIGSKGKTRSYVFADDPGSGRWVHDGAQIVPAGNRRQTIFRRVSHAAKVLMLVVIFKSGPTSKSFDSNVDGRASRSSRGVSPPRN